MAKKRIALCLAAVWLMAGITTTLAGAKMELTNDWNVKLDAANLLQVWMDAIKEQKLQAGLGITEEDIHSTGMIGTVYTPITTTHGDLAAKRTTANPDMAALVVELLEQAGIQTGDRIGAGFSGSFPVLNLAVLAACQVMDVECVYIPSVGASTYGANQPEVTFPDMIYKLLELGLLKQTPAFVTAGGDYDCGREMDSELRDSILERIAGYGAQVVTEPDYEANLTIRMAAYNAGGAIRCFIGVGGNIATMGLEDIEIPCGLISPGKYQARNLTDRSGLLQRYNAQGLPVIHLLNIKQLVADHRLIYDPEQLPPPGESAIYYKVVYPKWEAVLCLAGAAITIWLGFHGPQRKKDGTS